MPRLPSGRESFSPNAAFFTHAPPANRMRFIEGAPAFAVEVRSENDYDATTEQHIVAKREDYFLAGTLVVWDVDPVHEVIACYHAGDPTHPVVYHLSHIADAEPAVPGWRVSVDDVFEDR